MAIGLITYDDASRREDLIDVVTNVSPQETPLLSTLRRGPDAKQTLHEYPTDTFADSADNAAVEGADFSTVDLTAPSRSQNITQIFTDNIRVSDTEATVSGVVPALQYQIQKGLTEHAKDIERALMAGSTASGSSGVARRLTGVINALTTNATTMASASTLTEDIYNNLMELVWGSTSASALPNTVFVGSKLKRAISGFTGSNTKNVDAATYRIPNRVDVYEGDFGSQKIMLHRDVPSADTGRSLVGVNTDYHMLSYLRPTTVRELGKDGDAERRQIVTEMTIEHRAEASGVVANRFNS